MSILYYSPGTTSDTTTDQVLNGLRAQLRDRTISVWPDCADKSRITTAIVWQPPTEFFDGLTNLKTILSVAAGVDHLMQHPALPSNVDVIRLTDAGMAEPMAQYVLYGVLHAQRQMMAITQAQREKRWDHNLKPLDVSQFHVGMLGAGELSLFSARRLVANGYKVSCWSRTEKQLSGMKHYTGQDGLEKLLPQINAIVCLLPLTPATKGILNEAFFKRLPKGAFVINPGRGGHTDEQALLHALDTEHLSGALLDVFDEEPLPESHSFWSHPKIIMTPHVAAPTPPDGAVEQMVENLGLIERGEKPRGYVKRDAGY